MTPLTPVNNIALARTSLHLTSRALSLPSSCKIFERYFADTLKMFSSTLKGIVYVNDVSLCLAVLRNLDAMLTRQVGSS